MLGATPAEAPLRPRYLEDIGGGLLARYRRSGVPADLEAAITALRESVEATPADSPFRVDRLANLGLGLTERHSSHERGADLEAAVAAMREACRSGLTIAPAIVLSNRPGMGRAGRARGKPGPRPPRRMGTASRPSTGCTRVQLLPGAKQTWLGDAQGLAAAAAYALARIGAPAAAMLALERGRARVLTEAIQRRSGRPCRRRASWILPPTPPTSRQLAKLRALESQERADRGRLTRSDARPCRADVLQDLARQARADLRSGDRAPPDGCRGTPGSVSSSTVEEVAAAAEPGRPLVALVINAAGSLALVVSRADELGDPDLRGDLGAAS